MARLSTVLLLSISALLASAAPSPSGRTQYGPKVIPNIWKKGAAAPKTGDLTFDLIFSPKDTAGLEAKMTEIALNQGEWLSEEEIASYIAPSDDARATVEAALKAAGVDSYSYSRNGDTLTVKTSIAKAANVSSLLLLLVLRVLTSINTVLLHRVLLIHSHRLFHQPLQGYPVHYPCCHRRSRR